MTFFRWRKKKYNKKFSDHLLNHFGPINFITRLAKENSIVLLDGRGFAAPNMSLRVSLANLFEEQYKEIGIGINDLVKEYYKEWLTGGRQ